MKRYALCTILLALAFGFQSCDMVNEDMKPCAEIPNVITKVNFIYDYNMQHTDLFTDHVGSAYLYVFDSDSTMMFRRSIHRADMGSTIDFTLTFDTTQLKAGNKYYMVAIAQGNRINYNVSDNPGFTLQNQMIPGKSKIGDYILKLDRDDDSYADFGVVDYRDAYGNNQQMIDTLWSTKPDEVQIANIPYVTYVPSAEKLPDLEYEVTLPMMRITNSIKVNVYSKMFDLSTDVNDYTFLIDFPNGNGTIDFTGNTLPAQELYYRALRKNLTIYTPLSQQDNYSTRAEGDEYAILSEFGVSRLQVKDESSLQIRDAKTNETLAKIDNFSDFLADYFEHGYDDNQEFLDREYNFTLEMELVDGKLSWYQIWCAILGWGKRVYIYTPK